MTRLEANREILELLSDMVEAHPEMRFTQLLFNSDALITFQDSFDKRPEVVNEYHLESIALLDRIKNSSLWNA